MEDKLKRYTFLFVIICFVGIGIIGIYNSNYTQKKEAPQNIQENISTDNESVSQDTEIKQETTISPTQSQENSIENKVTEKPSTSTKTETPTQQEEQKPIESKQETQTDDTQNQQSEPIIEDTKEIYHVSLMIQGIDTVIGEGQMDIEEGKSVYDVLKAYTDQHSIEVKKSGSGSTVYVKGINGLNQFDYGARSGWMYKVNDISPNVGAGSYQLKDGDQVVWYYVYE